MLRTHQTVHDAYAAMDRIADTLEQGNAPEDWPEIYVVDAERRPVPRPGAH